MTSTQIGSYVNVGVRPEISEVSTIATEISKCYLEGCYDDYIFFYNGSQEELNSTYYEFLLVVGDLTHTPGVYPPYYQFDNCTVYQFFVVDTVVSSSVRSDFSGRTLDTDSSPVGVFSGTFTTPDLIHSYTPFAEPVDNLDSVQVHNSGGQMFYSSYEHDPHLVEGVQNYAFTLCVFLFVAAIFFLAHSIFRRVY